VSASANPAGAAAIEVSGLAKSFVLHNQGGAELQVLSRRSLEVRAGECVALQGRSGSGKSTLLKCLYANYRASAGSIRIGGTEVTRASPRELLRLRRETIGYVSQFLRVIPRVPALAVVAEPLLEDGPYDERAAERARQEAEQLLLRLRIPMRLWRVAPATFSGGEQQRINIARGLIRKRPVLLLDEPTASLDAENRATVVAMINEARAQGAAIVGIFHDREVRDAVATRVLDLEQAA
jgi:alpha-D-ribose 1-methylphosphonate 5-triphosphate synthase subunit PhnL